MGRTYAALLSLYRSRYRDKGYSILRHYPDNDATYEKLQGQLQKGVWLLNQSGNGNFGVWALGREGRINAQDMLNLSNAYHPIVISSTQRSMHLSRSSIATAWLDAPKGGAVAFVGFTNIISPKKAMAWQEYLNDVLAGGFSYPKDESYGWGMNSSEIKANIG